MPIARAVTLYANDETLIARRDFALAAITAEKPGVYGHYREYPEWELRPYFMDPMIPVSVQVTQLVASGDIKEVLLQTGYLEKIRDKAAHGDDALVRQACWRALDLYTNGRTFDFEDAGQLADVTANLDVLLENGLLDATTRTNILGMSVENTTELVAWITQFNEGRLDADKLFFVDPGNGPTPFDNEWPQFKAVWWPL